MTGHPRLRGSHTFEYLESRVVSRSWPRGAAAVTALRPGPGCYEPRPVWTSRTTHSVAAGLLFITAGPM